MAVITHDDLNGKAEHVCETRKTGGGLLLLGIVALPACSPGGHSSGEGSVVQTVTSALGASPATWRQEGPMPLTNCGVHGAAVRRLHRGGAAGGRRSVGRHLPRHGERRHLQDDRFLCEYDRRHPAGAGPLEPAHRWRSVAVDGRAGDGPDEILRPSSPAPATFSSEGATGTQGVVYLLKNGGANVTTISDSNLVGHKISAIDDPGEPGAGDHLRLRPIRPPGRRWRIRASRDGGHTGRASSAPEVSPRASATGGTWSPTRAIPIATTSSPERAATATPVHQGGIYVGTNSGQTWTMISALDTTSDIQSKLNNARSARLAVSPAGRLYLEIIQFNEPVYVGYTDDGGHHFKAMDLPSFPPANCDSGTPPNQVNPVAITNVTVGADGKALVTTSGPRCKADPGGTRVRITGVQGLPALSGDYVTIAVPDGDNKPSPTQLTLGDPLIADGNGNPITIMAADLVGGVAAPSGNGDRDRRHPPAVGGAKQWARRQAGHRRQSSPPTPNLFYISGDATDEMVVRGDTTAGATGGFPSPQWVSIAQRRDHQRHASPRGHAPPCVRHERQPALVCDGGLYLRKNPQSVDAWYDLNGDLRPPRCTMSRSTRSRTGSSAGCRTTERPASARASARQFPGAISTATTAAT